MYAILYANFGHKTMQSQLEDHPDYNSKVIKTLMHNPMRAQ